MTDDELIAWFENEIVGDVDGLARTQPLHSRMVRLVALARDGIKWREPKEKI